MNKKIKTKVIFTIVTFILFFGLSFFAAPDISLAAYTCNGVTQNVSTGPDCTEVCKSVGIPNAQPLFNDAGYEPDNKKCCCKRPDTSAGGSATRTGGAQGTFEVEDTNPLRSLNIPELAGQALRALFGVIGTIALAIFIYGGALWMLSLGDEQRVTRARETMIWAGLGLLAVFGSYVVVQFILNALIKTPPATAPDAHSALRIYDSTGKSGSITSIIEGIGRL